MKQEHAPGEKNIRKRVWRIVGILLACALGIAAALFLIDGRHVRFYMTGGTEISVSYGQPYEDPGCRAVSVGRLSGEGETELPVMVSGAVDTETLGSYELCYTAHCYLFDYSTIRTVHVVDDTPPEIRLEYMEGYTPNWFTGYEEEGYTAMDDCDGELTDQVEVFLYEDRVEYRVSDAAGNVAEVVRPLEYTVTRPEIQLEGGEEIEIDAQFAFSDPGYRAIDSLGNDLTEFVQVEGDVTAYREGDYTLQYSISNQLGETVSATRTVHVKSVSAPETIEPEGYVIYLTFDDGPGIYTGQLLDLLARYNVRATFFVTCLNPDYEDMVGRAFREGHSIGVHTASHNYYDIYSSEEAFLADFNRTEAMIYRQTGSYTKLFRFPGGSSNTVSSFNPGIMSRLAQIMTDMGYCYFDWNVTSGDAGETTETKTVVDNIIGGCAGRRVSVVLQHDIKDFSINAVEKVLSWGLRNGYTFLPLDTTSPVTHHGIRN